MTDREEHPTAEDYRNRAERAEQALAEAMAENARLLANVRAWVEWHRRCDADPDCTYLNDNAWCDAEAMASEGGVLLARAKLGKGPLDG